MLITEFYHSFRGAVRTRQIGAVAPAGAVLILFAIQSLRAQTGLVAAYSFNEGTGTTVSDVSGNGNNGTVSNTTWTTAGKYGSALVFNGTNAWVTIPDSASLHLTTGMTLEAWVNPTAVTNAYRDVIYKGNDNYYLEATSDSTTPAGGATFGTTGALVKGTAALALNTWTHLAVTYDAATLRLYVNGTQVASAARTGNIATSTNALRIGGDSFYGQYFKGTIDDVRVYNVARTAAQIQTDMNTPAGPAAPDTQPPTAPGTPTLNAISGTQVNLSWTASTDNIGVTGYLIERCAGVSCTSFSQIGSISSTTYQDTSVVASTSYTYRIRATDAANNLSPYSGVSTVSTPTPDLQAPTVPGTPALTVVSGGQINLSWGASTDNVAVTGYLIERCQGTACSTFAQIAAAATTSYQDTGLSAATSYTYRLRATDAAGNLSGYSGVASATTLSTIPGLVAAYSFDEGAGTTVADSSGNGNKGTINGATWTNVGKFGNALVFNGTSSLVTIADSPSLHLTSAMTLEAWINPSTVTNSWRDILYKPNDNYYLEATSDRNTPAGGGTFGGTGVATYGTAALAQFKWVHLALTYDGATLRLYLNGTQIGSVAKTGAITTSTSALTIGGDTLFGQYFNGTIDEVRIYNVALSAAQIASDMNTPVGVSTLDTQAPTAPGIPAPSVISGTEIDLSWPAATDNVAVTGYMVERCQGPGCTSFAQIGTPSASTYADTGLTANTSYSYRVRATDAAGNVGPYSAVASATTAAPDVQPPTVPGTPTASSTSAGQITVNWTASTDNVAVTAYLVERCQGTSCTNFAQIGSTPGISYQDSGLAASTTYSYRVRATDAAGNLSGYSTLASATTAATTPGLVAAYAFNEGTGTTIADSSGNGNTGTITSATWTAAGKYGSALVFNGTNAWVTVNDSAPLHLSSAMTLEAWVNPSVVTATWRDVIYKATDNYYLEATSDQGPPGGGGTFGGTGAVTMGATALPANTWTHLAVTYDGANLILYVNGTQVASQARTGAITSSTSPLRIGGDSAFGQYFAGIIDEIRIYNVALTAAQIQADMANPVGSPAPVPAVSLSATSLSFGSLPTGTASTPQPVTLTNSGNGPLTITGISITGPNAADFGQTNNCGSTLSAGANCTMNVTFTPGNTGTRSGTLSISDNAQGNPHNVALSGTGTGLSVSPSAAAITSTRTQQFTASVTGVSWSVDGVPGGSASTGTINATGLYTPPGTTGTHTVTATTADHSQSASASVYVTNYLGTFTFHNDNLRTGQNLNEIALTPNNVNPSQFGKLASYAIDGIAHASPLYVAGVNIPGNGIRSVVYVATEHDSVYAFDADGGSTTPFWKVSFINAAAGITTVPPADTGECCDIAPEIGITGTPVIDQASGTLYVVAKTKEISGGNTNYVQRLHALDIATGAEKFGGPVAIQASVPGSGDGAVGGQLPFNSLRENQRPGLLLNNGVVYIGFASHGDNVPWHGWVLGYNATTLQQVMAYSVTPNGYGGGIWHSGGGLPADTAGNIYFVTGNGTFDANTGGPDYGDSFVKISPAGTVLDYFTPHTQGNLNTGNVDLGAGGLLLLPDQPGANPHLLLSAGKDGTIYVINRDNMGHYNASNDNQIVQSLVNIFPNGTPEPGNFSSPVYFNGNVYFSPISDTVKLFKMTNGLMSTAPVSQSSAIYSYPGGTMAISANGTANAILWTVQRNGTSAPGVLHAYDANNLSVELYNSNQAAGSRDTMDFAAKFSVPLVANGKVYVSTNAQLITYGLLP